MVFRLGTILVYYFNHITEVFWKLLFYSNMFPCSIGIEKDIGHALAGDTVLGGLCQARSWHAPALEGRQATQ